MVIPTSSYVCLTHYSCNAQWSDTCAGWVVILDVTRRISVTKGVGLPHSYPQGPQTNLSATDDFAMWVLSPFPHPKRYALSR